MRQIRPFRASRRTASIFTAFCLVALSASGSGLDVSRLLIDAEKGELTAEMSLAASYENGTDTPQDYGKALFWYSKAAEQGNSGAMARIGYFYERGKGVSKDAERALGLYKEAATFAEKTQQQNFANGYILRLSRSGAVKEKYGGIPMEGGLLLVKLDDSTPLDVLIQNLKDHPKEVETGKAYWIGYNEQMIALAARGEQAIPPLVELINSTVDAKVRYAGLLTLHLIGIGGEVAGRFEEDFSDRAAREAFWKLLTVEGLTDDVVELLKRDPWPADVPVIMSALAQVKADCPLTLNALSRYPLPSNKLPIDSLGQTGVGGITIRFTIPKNYTDRDYVRVAIEGIKAFPGKVEVEDGLLDKISTASAYGNSEPKEWTGSLSESLALITDHRPPFNFVSSGRPVYYFAEGMLHEEDHPVVLHICSATTAKKRLLAWWQTTGRNWYVSGRD